MYQSIRSFQVQKTLPSTSHALHNIKEQMFTCPGCDATHCVVGGNCECNDSKNCITKEPMMDFASSRECLSQCKQKQGGMLSCPAGTCCRNGRCVQRSDPGSCPSGQLPCRNASRTSFTCCKKGCNIQTGQCLK